MTDIQGVRIALVTVFLIVVAMVVGYRRGAAREAATLVILGISSSLLFTTVGGGFIDGVNVIGVEMKQLWSQLQAAILNRPDSGMNAESLANWRLIPLKQQEAVIFIIFLISVFIAYRIGGLAFFKGISHPSAGGAVLGLVNAYILGLVLLPSLPKAVPAPQQLINGQELTRQAAETFRVVASGIGVTFTSDNLMTAIILLVALLMYWAVNELR
jgi:hypothetical protein